MPISLIAYPLGTGTVLAGDKASVALSIACTGDENVNKENILWVIGTLGCFASPVARMVDDVAVQGLREASKARIKQISPQEEFTQSSTGESEGQESSWNPFYWFFDPETSETQKKNEEPSDETHRSDYIHYANKMSEIFLSAHSGAFEMDRSEITLLGTNVALRPGESISCKFAAQIPPTLPPTFRGQIFRYSHFAMIGIAIRTSNGQVKKSMLRVPLRVVAVDHVLLDDILQLGGPEMEEPRLDDPQQQLRTDILRGDIERKRELRKSWSISIADVQRTARQRAFAKPNQIDSSHPLLRSGSLRLSLIQEDPDDLNVDERSFLGEAMSRIAILSSPSPTVMLNAGHYKIGSGDSHICRVSIAGKAFRLGQDIPIRLDFQESKLKCYETVVRLEMHEVLSSDLMPENGDSKETPSPVVTAMGELRQTCRHSQILNLSIQVPINCCPDFRSEHVSISWKLTFGFIFGDSDAKLEGTNVEVGIPNPAIDIDAPKDKRQLLEDKDIQWHAPSGIDISVYKWTHPVTILPCNPSSMPMARLSRHIVVG
eukprot:Clim_evm88s109 gene=Clim_evmTU88s109